MSVNRRGRGKGATKRAYLKNFSADRSPKGGKPPNKDVVAEYNARAYKGGVEPPRATVKLRHIDATDPKKLRIVESGRTPTITEPKAAVVKSLHLAWRNGRRVYRTEVARTSFVIVWHCFDGFDARAVHWIVQFNRAARTANVSMTYSSKEKVLAVLNQPRIPWKYTDLPWPDDQGNKNGS